MKTVMKSRKKAVVVKPANHTSIPTSVFRHAFAEVLVEFDSYFAYLAAYDTGRTG